MSEDQALFGAAAAATAPTALREAQRRRKGVQAALDLLERAIAAPSTGREAEWVALVAEQSARPDSAVPVVAGSRFPAVGARQRP